jgi:hypothetical protein
MRKKVFSNYLHCEDDKKIAKINFTDTFLSQSYKESGLSIVFTSGGGGGGLIFFGRPGS